MEVRTHMGLLEGKRALIFGLANDHSIAWGIAQALHREGAEVAFSSVEMLLDKRVKPLAARLGSTFVEPCDVQKDEDIERVFARYKEEVGSLDILVHAVAFANKDELGGEFIRTSREGFALAHDVSAYSLVALAREARPLMSDGGTILTLSYYGAEKAVVNYNVMGVAKASLEACVRYLAVDLGKEGIRVNAISAGPVRTLAAAGVSGFKKMYKLFEQTSPMRRPLSIDDLGNAAVYLCSDLSRGTTGEIHYVDGGYNIIGVPEVVD
jgi:enoyl-[acyl-carrier protein] reductase I